MGKSILAGLEALETESNDDVVAVDIESILKSCMEVSMEDDKVEDIADDIDDMSTSDDEFESSVEQLTTLKDAIEEYGLSKPMIAVLGKTDIAALEDAGIIPSFEELNDLPTKGDAANASVEAISETLKKGWEKVIAFLKMLWEKIKEYFTKFVNLFRNQINIVKGMEKRIKSGKFDEKAFNEKKEAVLSFTEFEKVVGEQEEFVRLLEEDKSFFGSDLQKFMEDVDSELKAKMSKKDMKQALETIEDKFSEHCSNYSKLNDVMTGVKVRTEDVKGKKINSILIKETKVFSNIEKEDLKTLGWTKDRVLRFLGNLNSKQMVIKTLEGEIKILGAVLSRLENVIKTLLSEVSSNTDKDSKNNRALLEQGLRVAKKIVVSRQQLMTKVISNIAKYSSMTLTIGRVAASSTK